MSESISSINYPLKWLLNHSFFSSSSQQISFFTFLNISRLNHQLFLLIFAPIYSVIFFWEFIKKRRDAHEKIFSIVLSTCKQVTKIAFSRSFLSSHRIFTAKGILFLRKIYFAREFTHTLIHFSLFSLHFPLAEKFFSSTFSCKERKKYFFLTFFHRQQHFSFSIKCFT